VNQVNLLKILNTRVISSNDKPVKNLKGFVQMVEKCKEEFLKFERPSHDIKKSTKAKRLRQRQHHHQSNQIRGKQPRRSIKEGQDPKEGKRGSTCQF
jgi:PDZ domain